MCKNILLKQNSIFINQNINKNLFISLGQINNQRYLIVSLPKLNFPINKYFLIDNNYIISNIKIDTVFEKNQASFHLELSTDNIDLAIQLPLLKIKIEKFLLNATKFYQKRLYIRGLGYRLDYILLDKEKKLFDKTKLEFKLGFSHSKIIEVNQIPSPIRFRFKIRKKSTVIHLQSANKTFLGNYTAKIASFKKINDYKEKGIIKRYQILRLKPVKKK